MNNQVTRFKQLINTDLPDRFTKPVRFNHCFNRIILDWLFDDCWYNHLDRKRSALSQLNPGQLERAINRMEAWFNNPELLNTDNDRSLAFRKYYKQAP